MALVIAWPSVLAASGLSASSFDVLGQAELRSDLQAAFLVLEDANLHWEAIAETAAVERHYLERYVVAPLWEGSASDWRSETTILQAATLAGTAAREGGAILARGDASALVTTSRGLNLGHAADPEFIQGPPPAASAGEGDRSLIRESLQGEFIATRLATGLLELRGDIVFDIRDIDYVARTADGDSSFRTGRYTTEDYVAANKVRIEYHTITLTDAVLRIELGQPLDLYSHAAQVTLNGQLLADGGAAAGLLDAGRGTLSLVAADGLVTASRPELLAASAAAPSPFAAPYVVPLAAALALALALALVSRRARADDVESALVAMSERRWRDALPRLERALRRRPDDASLLLDHAICLEMLGRLPRAARAYEATLRRTPRSAEAHFFLARTLAKLQQSEPGTVHLQTALELDPRLVEMARAERAFRTLGVAR